MADAQPVDESRSYSSEDVRRLFGVPYRFIDYWARQLGLTTGSGHPRQWSEDDLLWLRDLIRLHENYRASKRSHLGLRGIRYQGISDG